MPALGRSYWAFVAILGYTSVEAIRSGGGLPPWLALFVLPLVLAEVFRRTRPEGGRELLPPEARTALRASSWGTALFVAARTGAPAQPLLDAAASLGAAGATVGALVALARLPDNGGLLQAPRAARSLDAALFTGFLWGIAIAIPGAYAVLPPESRRFDPLLIDYAVTSAGLGSLLVLVAATLRLSALRSTELGVADRARSALALSVSALAIAVPAAWLDVAPPDRVLPAAAAIAALACAWAVTTPDATFVTRLVRGLLAVLLLGAPLLVVTTLLAQALPAHAPAIVLSSSALAIVVGLAAQAAARPLGPERSRWLTALDRAARDALEPEPNAALRASLAALSRVADTPGPRPEIWQREPPEVLSVDIAGHLQNARAEAPARLYDLGLAEPERTLRLEVLRALEVRRPEVRGLITWLDARGALSATIILDGEGPIGFLLLPRGARASAMTIEEARAARLLADRISSLLSVASSLASGRERERAAVARADSSEQECKRLEHIIAAEASRHRELGERAARPARAAAYSSAARAALEGIERHAERHALLALLAPPGLEVSAWAAHFHTRGPRAGGPLVTLDATSAAEQTLELWQSEQSSPLRAADGGTLVVLAATALPLAVQEALAATLGRRGPGAGGSSVPPPGVVLALPAPLDKLVGDGTLSPALARLFAETELRLPALAERPEDLRALTLDVLTRRCLELGREPLGISPPALRLVLEHSWPENELELSALLGRAAALAGGKLVEAADLERAGLGAAQPIPPPPPPAATRRRASFRPLRRS